MAAEGRSTLAALSDAYRTMVTIRRCEEAIGRLFNEGLIYGTAHLSIGQEAVPVGVCAELRRDDHLTTTYRGHGWAIAKGVGLTPFFGELMGREIGLCRGRGGSMHLCDMGVGLIGATGIVGGGLPIAVGSAYAAQVAGSDRVAVTTFGDGATNIGTFHESINIAAVWRLPVVFVCENNLYGEFTPAHETCLLDDLADRATAYGLAGVVVDGNDLEAVREVAAVAVARARAGGGPTLIEAKTYRHRGHSRNDAARYRPDGELERWLDRDPLRLLRARLDELGWDEDRDDELSASVDASIADAIEAARAAPYPEAGELSAFVYSASGVADEPADGPALGSDGAGEVVTYRQAVTRAIAGEMDGDARVVLFGEDVAAAGGAFKATDGLQARFGRDRVRDTPIAENAIVGMAIGAAAAGLRPIVEIMFADFLPNAFDQLVNHAGKLRYMSGGQLSLPLVVRAAHGGGIGFGAQHSQAATSWLLPFPGIKIVAPATPAEVDLLLRAAIRDPDPVLVLEHKALYGLRGPGAAPDAAIPRLGTPRLARAGRDITILSLGGTVRRAETAAEELSNDGIDCELIDLRGLVPLDERAIVESVRRTGRLLAVEEEPAQGGWAGGVVSRLVQAAWPALVAPPSILSGADVPIPYAPTLEQAYSVSSDGIVAAVRALVESEVEA